MGTTLDIDDECVDVDVPADTRDGARGIDRARGRNGLMLIMLRHELALGGIRHVAASTPEVDRGLLFKEQPAEPSQASVGSATLRRSGA
jgi:hypothetical protein